MIYGSWALAFNLLNMAILAFIVANILVSVVFFLVKNKLQDYTVSSRKSLLWLFVLSPWLVALSVTFFFCMPFQSTSSFIWLTKLVHWHHQNSFDFLSWHSVSLITFIVFSCYIVLLKMIVLYKNHHQIRLLRALSTLDITNNKQVYVIESPIPTAFTAGLIKPSCYISTGLIEKLSVGDIEIIIQHELAHLHHRDPLKKWLFSFLAVYFFTYIKQLLISKMSLSMEHDADAFLVENQKKSRQHQLYKVAGTLVKFTKLAANYAMHPRCKNESHNNELFVHFCRQSLEQRVMHLLSDKQFKVFPKKIVLVTTFILTLVSITSVDSIHHTIEILFSH
ncbi:MAG: M56 family metallopeptidase [Colwellia sp.]|nr:M56 family metallopeptidase [Colwellia sp.]